MEYSQSLYRGTVAWWLEHLRHTPRVGGLIPQFGFSPSASRVSSRYSGLGTLHQSKDICCELTSISQLSVLSEFPLIDSHPVQGVHCLVPQIS